MIKKIILLLLIAVTCFAQDTLIGAWRTITPPTGTVNDTTMLVCFEFNYSADSSEIVDISNYQVKDMFKTSLPLYSIYWITEIDDLDVIYTRLVGLRVPKLKHKNLYSFEYKTQADTFFYSGYHPNLIGTPDVLIR